MYKSKKYLPNSMSSRPGYTSGRGATISDLDSKKLKHIYGEILKEEGSDAANSFIQMVKHLKVASCTEFLLSMYRLETNNWVYSDDFFGEVSGNGVHIENEGEAIGTILSAFGGSNKDETLRIVSPFLRKFGEEHITQNDHTNGYTDEYGHTYSVYGKTYP